MERFGGQFLQVGRGGAGEGPGAGPGIYFSDPKSTRRGRMRGWGSTLPTGSPSYREAEDPADVGGQGWWRLWGRVAITCQIG